MEKKTLMFQMSRELILKIKLKKKAMGKSIVAIQMIISIFLDNKTYKSEKEIMEYDLYKVRKSDVIIVNFNDPSSIGTACEIAIAHEYSIPIIGLCEHDEENNLHPWLKEFCSRIFIDREELVLYLLQHYVDEN